MQVLNRLRPWRRLAALGAAGSANLSYTFADDAVSAGIKKDGFTALEERGTMTSNDGDRSEMYKVVVNHEEQYSIWPADRENALGWSDEGKSGTKQECLDHIDEVWTDMRPLSLRQHMESSEQAEAET